MVLQRRTQHLAPPAPASTTEVGAAAVREATRGGFPLAGCLLIVVWRRFYIAYLDYKRKWALDPVTWMPSEIAQLAEVVLLYNLFPAVFPEVFDMTITAAVPATRPLGHPQVCALLGQQGNAAVGAQMTALLQQVSCLHGSRLLGWCL